jgi:transglutaminase-like putative cysteine protease
MRRLRIDHLTTYQFGAWVQLLPHKLLLRPREGHDMRVESSRLVITPASKVKWHRDVYGNSMCIAEFSEMSNTLRIASEVVIQHFDESPMDFVINVDALQYPFLYKSSEQEILLPYQKTCYPDDLSAVKEWVSQFLRAGQSVNTFDLLFSMNKAIANGFRYQAREAPGVQSPSETLKRRGGSCRDFATLFIEACRVLGLGARFISGYLHCAGTQTGAGSTHAWAEVYLPGAGWKGFDSTSGVMTGVDHIAVATSRHPADVPPVAGSFVGPGGILPALLVGVQVRAL